MPFIKEILKYDSLSIVGLEKNVGKTQCLNYILSRLPLESRGVCITSIGVDGEKVDQVTSTEKPEIHISEGCLFCTSEKHYRQRELVSELLAISDETTSLGRILVARAVSPGKVMLSGPASTPALVRLMNTTKTLGVRLNIVDGALSRLSSASPAVSQAMILSTGAAFSANLATLVAQTAFVVDRINLPLYTEKPDEQCLELSSMGAALPANMKDFTVFSVTGALTDRLLGRIAALPHVEDLEIRVKDFTRIFVTPQAYRNFLARGGRITVAQRSKLIAVTVNPTAPNGFVINSDRLCAELSSAIGLPVYDLVKNRYEA